MNYRASEGRTKLALALSSAADSDQEPSPDLLLGLFI